MVTNGSWVKTYCIQNYAKYSIISSRKNFSEAEIEIFVSKFDVDGDALFDAGEITRIKSNNAERFEQKMSKIRWDRIY